MIADKIAPSGLALIDQLLVFLLTLKADKIAPSGMDFDELVSD